MKKKWQIILSWTLVSVMLQLPIYYLLNRQIEKVMTPATTQPIVRTLKTTISGTNFENMQISYGKDYIAYEENGILKVYNLKQDKQVFTKSAPSNDKNLGVLYFQWLPDRNTLVYFYARKNPNPVTTETVPVTPAPSTSQSTASANSSTSKTPASSNTTTTVQKPKGNTAHTQEATSTQVSPPNTAQIQATKPETVKTEDPQQAPVNSTTPASTPTQEQRVVTHYSNPQITDLYTLELPNSDEDTEPDDRFNESISSFPAGGQITDMVVSTFTNLIYLTVKTGSNSQLMEIDVMKNVRTLSRSGELITEMAASDKFGTLYIESKTGNSKVIQSLQGTQRQTVSEDNTETILGDRFGTLYLGQIDGNNLVKIRSAAENSTSTKLEFKTIWQGSIPFKDASVVIGTNSQIVINSNQTAYLIQKDGQLKQVELTGKNNFISKDGAELVELTPNGSSTDIELKPLQ
ncbi:hypothetical protein [Desulfitobacterium sp. AusDCA]|uniref:hypothetical protein n=1 Tax=Desulfitobacterium sp. AusDCA TaxID=3240383 RepID=UPI003DA77E39